MLVGTNSVAEVTGLGSTTYQICNPSNCLENRGYTSNYCTRLFIRSINSLHKLRLVCIKFLLNRRECSLHNPVVAPLKKQQQDSQNCSCRANSFQHIDQSMHISSTNIYIHLHSLIEIFSYRQVQSADSDSWYSDEAHLLTDLPSNQTLLFVGMFRRFKCSCKTLTFIWGVIRMWLCEVRNTLL